MFRMSYRIFVTIKLSRNCHVIRNGFNVICHIFQFQSDAYYTHLLKKTAPACLLSRLFLIFSPNRSLMRFLLTPCQGE